MTDALHESSKRHYAINLIENSRGRLLLLRRSLELELGPGLWGFCAGRLEPGESGPDCSRREMREELGSDHRVELLRAVEPRGDSFYGGTMVLHLFHYRWLGGAIVLNPEHTEWAWVAPAQWRDYAVMDGMDEDIDLLGVWPREYLNSDRLPGD